MKKALLIITLPFLITGCFFPTTETYLEANVAEKENISTHAVSLGLYKVPKASIYLRERDVHIGVSPYFRVDDNLKLSVSISDRKGNIKVDPDQIKILLNNKQILAPSKINISHSTTRKYGYDGEFKNKWIHLEYLASLNEIQEIKIIFPDLYVNSKKLYVNTSTFKFKKVTKTGIRLFTIND